MLGNSCYVLRAKGVLKVSNSKGDLQGHLMALAMVLFDRPRTVSHQPFHCNNVSILHRFRNIITYFLKLKEVTLTLNTSLLGVIYHACTRTLLYQSVHEI